MRSSITKSRYSGPTLEEIAKIFDGRDAEVAHVKSDIMGISMARPPNDKEVTEIRVAAVSPPNMHYVDQGHSVDEGRYRVHSVDEGRYHAR